MVDRAVRHKFERGPHKDHPSQIWFNLFQRRFRCDLNLHNLYKLVQQKISQKTPEYIYTKLLIAM